MKHTILFLFAFALSAQADNGVLLQRIVQLEKRVAELEARLAPVLEEERVKVLAARQKEVARERMLMDAEIHQRHDLNVIEKLYHAANQDWKAEYAGKAVAILSKKYPLANRTGCAVLSRAQAVDGDEQLELLEKAISSHNGCFYANGVQVGAYARLYYLAMRHKRDGNDKKAARLFQEIRTDFPNAIDHNGQLLTSHLEGMD